MSDTTQDTWMAILAKAMLDMSRADRGVTGHGGEYVIIHCPTGLKALAEWLDQRHLLIPRSDVAGYQYAYQWTHDGDQRRFLANNEVDAISYALELRALQRRNGQPVDAVAVSAPIPPWTPIPLPQDGQS